MSGNNPFGDQPGPPQNPNQPGPSYGGPGYSGPYNQPTPSGPYPPNQGPGQYGGGPQGPGQYGGGPQGPGQYGGGPQGPDGPQGPGGPQQPYGMYSPGQPQPKKNKTPLIIGAAALALVLIGTIVGIAVTRGNNGPAATPGGSGGTSAPPAEAALPSDAVRGFLEALAAGDAQTALGYAQTQPTDTTFLTNEVLAASAKLAPITGINVPEVNDEYAYSVDASYKLGSQAVNTSFTVEKEGDAWKLREVAYDLDLGSQRSKTLPMVVNGVSVATDSILLFPCSYEFTTGSKNVGYGKSNVLAVQSPSDYPRGLAEIQPTLTSAGEKEFTSALENSLEKCMKSKKMENPGCPNSFDRTSGPKPKDGTFKWSYDKDALDNLKVDLVYSNPAVAEAYVSLGLEAIADCENGGTCTYTPTFGNRKPTANLTKDPVKISWK